MPIDPYLSLYSLSSLQLRPLYNFVLFTALSPALSWACILKTPAAPLLSLQAEGHLFLSSITFYGQALILGNLLGST